jgi:Resolvase, N terminal domain
MVTVTGIDRLARSTFDLFAIVEQIVDAMAQFRSLAERARIPHRRSGPPVNLRGLQKSNGNLLKFRNAYLLRN